MKQMRHGKIRWVQTRSILLILLLWCCSQVALALGLEDIQVLSRPGEPLIAQIPIVSDDPDELTNATVGLASDDVFRRVGLQLPDNVVRSLEFSFAKDTYGRALIWVTSPNPINQKAISFLVALEWPQGKVVREYTALIDTPNTIQAQEPPPIIEGPDASRIAITPKSTSPTTPAPSSPAEPATSSSPDSVAANQTAPSVPPAGEIWTTVKKGETLSELAQDVAQAHDVTLNQAMLALLRENPNAFINNNINRLRQGAVLRSPSQRALSAYGASQAAAIVRAQAAQWRQASMPVLQPAQTGAISPPTPLPDYSSTPQNTDRLEIAANASQNSHIKAKGALSGTHTSGDGDMLESTDMQQAKEDLASQQAEIQELHARINALEHIQQKQAELLTLKDSELAEAGKRLHTHQDSQPNASQEFDKLHSNSGLYAGLGIFALFLGLLSAFAWYRSRSAKQHSKHSVFGTLQSQGRHNPINGIMPNNQHQRKAAPGPDFSRTPANPFPTQSSALAHWFTRLVSKKNASSAKADTPHAQTHPNDANNQWASSSQWVSFAPKDRAFGEKYAPPPSDTSTPTSNQDTKDQQTTMERASVDVVKPAPEQQEQPLLKNDQAKADAARMHERLELARAYYELGDRKTAGILLNEVRSGNNLQARSEADELLKKL